MKLLLTSAGLTDQRIVDEFVNIINDQMNQRVAVLHTIRQPEDWLWLDQQKNELGDLGLEYDFINISENVDLSKMGDYGVYYVTGGNTFYILDRLRKNDLDSFLAKAVKEGSLYVGLSAGSIIAGPDIEIAEYGLEPDENDVGLKDLTGFGLVDFHIFPHYVDGEKEIVGNFRETRGEKVLEINDRQAALISDYDMVVIG